MKSASGDLMFDGLADRQNRTAASAGSATADLGQHREKASSSAFSGDGRASTAVGPTAKGERSEIVSTCGSLTAKEMLAHVTALIATLEAWRTELHLEVQAADEPTDEDWAAYEAMCRDDELHPRRERFADEIEDARDAVEDRAIALNEVTR